MPGYGMIQIPRPDNHARPTQLGSEQVIIKMLTLKFFFIFYKKIFKLSLKYHKKI